MVMLGRFQVISDGIHAVALGVVLRQLLVKKDAQGISRKTLDLLLLAHICRTFAELRDAPDRFVADAAYVVVFDLLKVSASVIACDTMRRNEALKATYRPDWDAVNHWAWLVLPTFVLAMLPSPDLVESITEAVTFFSILMESAALYPQIYLLGRHGNTHILVGGMFVLLMGAHHIVFLFGCLGFGFPSDTSDYIIFHENIVLFSLVILLIGAFAGCCSSSSSSSNNDNRGADSNVSALFWQCLLRDTPWGRILAVVTFIPVYFFLNFFGLNWIGEGNFIDSWYLGHDIAALGLLIVICNPIILTCCYFWYFFRCCCSSKKRRETYLQLDDEEATSTPSLTDSAQIEGGGGSYEQASTTEDPLTFPSSAASLPRTDDEFADEVDEHNHLPVRNQSNGMIVIILFGWASTFTLCFLAVQAPEFFYTSLPILSVIAGCIRRCVPDVASDLEEYNEVSTEHELGDLAVSPVATHDLELIAEDKQQAGVEFAKGDTLDGPLLTPEQQKEAALEIKRAEAASYQAPNTLSQESETSETV